MHIVNRKEQVLLFLGDSVFFFLALWLMLFVRYAEIPSLVTLSVHVTPFSILFLVWVVVFFIAGLYEKHTVILKGRLPAILFNAQIVNSIIGVLFFYFIPYFGITPKTNLFIYLAISFGLLLFWRLYGFGFLSVSSKENALLIGSGKEAQELREEVNNNSRYSLQFTSFIDLDEVRSVDFQKEILNRIQADGISIVVVDLQNEKVSPILPHLYDLIFSQIHFVDIHKMYEVIFDRVPLSLIRYTWFLENISLTPKVTYDFVKRSMDIVLSLSLGIISLIFYPFVWFAIKMDDKGVLFSYQTRVGQNNQPINIMKFRTMSVANDDGKWGSQKNVVTRVGKFLRKSRIDELPQIWNVLRGDISFIGPRPEFPEPVKKYQEQISYYNVRHIIKPGLSGWAQIYHERHPHHGLDVEETKNKLSYDLFYIKNRSIVLDLKIALRTLKILFTFAGR